MNAVSAPELVTLGETMALLRSSSVGSLQHARSMDVGIGGAESNVAIGVARLGHRCAWMGRLGSDSLGDLVERELRAEDLTLGVVRDAQSPTGLMLKESRTAEHRRVWYYRAGSAGSRLCPSDLDEVLVSSARILHVTGITPALSASAAAAVERAVDVAVTHGVQVTFDVNYRAALWSRERASATLTSLAERADVIFGSPDELALLTQAPQERDVGTLLAALARPGRVVVAKLGAQGAEAEEAGARVRQAAVDIDAVDTVGAGDAFVAGYLSEMLRAAPLAERMATAVRTGAFACLAPGDWEGLPTRAELGLLGAEEAVTR